MPPKKKAATVTAVTKKETMSLEKATSSLRSVVTFISSMLGPDATHDQVAAAFDACKSLEENTEFLVKLAREQVLSRLKAEGSPTDTGGLSLKHNGWVLRANRTHTGLDPKKVEARLREARQDPGSFMYQTISYKLIDSVPAMNRLLAALGPGAKDCHYDERWQVQAPEQLDTYHDEQGRLMTASGSNVLE